MQLCRSLSKFDHVNEHYSSLKWLPLQQLIQFRSVCVMYHQYYHTRGIPLSPIKFGCCQSLYHTRTANNFANPDRFHLTFSQRFFRYKASNWWNSVPHSVPRDNSFTAFYNDYYVYLLVYV